MSSCLSYVCIVSICVCMHIIVRVYLYNDDIYIYLSLFVHEVHILTYISKQ